MTTQATKCTLFGQNLALDFDKTATDDTWNEMLDAVNSLSLYETMLGESLHGAMGYYTAGSGMIRIRNTQNNKVKMIEPIHMIKGQRYFQFTRVVKVEMYDVLEVFSTVAGS
jgi:hypothetical protein